MAPIPHEELGEWKCASCGAIADVRAWPAPCRGCGSRAIVSQKQGTMNYHPGDDKRD